MSQLALAATVAFDSYNLHKTENYSFNFESISNYVALGVNEEVISNSTNSEFFKEINTYMSQKYGVIYESGLIRISGVEDQALLVQSHKEILRLYDARIITLQASPVDVEFKSLLQSLRTATHNQLVRVEMSRITLIASEQIFLAEFQKLALNYYGVQLPISDLTQIQLSIQKSETIDFGSTSNTAEAKRQFVTALSLRQGLI